MARDELLPRWSAGGAAHTRRHLAWGATGRWWSPPLSAHLPCHPRSRTVQAGDAIARLVLAIGTLFLSSSSFDTCKLYPEKGKKKARRRKMTRDLAKVCCELVCTYQPNPIRCTFKLGWGVSDGVTAVPHRNPAWHQAACTCSGSVMLPC